MTTEQELNEKLARFAGLELICSREDDEWHRGIWKTKEGIQISTPDFIHDINACIEYLGPKLEGIIISGICGRQWVACIRWKGSTNIIMEGTSPALAFSRAVEEAIDKGAK